jgi:hypothetical protein
LRDGSGAILTPIPKPVKTRASKSKGNAKAKADRYFSLYIRARDTVNGVCRCITCGKPTSEPDCGHMISRRFEATRYDEKNANGQCGKCNRFENGNQFAHSLAIDQKHGEGTSLALFQKSKMLCRRKQIDYEYIAQEFKAKYEALND